MFLLCFGACFDIQSSPCVSLSLSPSLCSFVSRLPLSICRTTCYTYTKKAWSQAFSESIWLDSLAVILFPHYPVVWPIWTSGLDLWSACWFDGSIAGDPTSTGLCGSSFAATSFRILYCHHSSFVLFLLRPFSSTASGPLSSGCHACRSFYLGFLADYAHPAYYVNDTVTGTATLVAAGATFAGREWTWDELAVTFAISLSLLAGIICLLMGMFRLGFLDCALSRPILKGPSRLGIWLSFWFSLASGCFLFHSFTLFSISDASSFHSVNISRSPFSILLFGRAFYRCCVTRVWGPAQWYVGPDALSRQERSWWHSHCWRLYHSGPESRTSFSPACCIPFEFVLYLSMSSFCSCCSLGPHCSHPPSSSCNQLAEWFTCFGHAVHADCPHLPCCSAEETMAPHAALFRPTCSDSYHRTAQVKIHALLFDYFLYRLCCLSPEWEKKDEASMDCCVSSLCFWSCHWCCPRALDFSSSLLPFFSAPCCLHTPLTFSPLFFSCLPSLIHFVQLLVRLEHELSVRSREPQPLQGWSWYTTTCSVAVHGCEHVWFAMRQFYCMYCCASNMWCIVGHWSSATRYRSLDFFWHRHYRFFAGCRSVCSHHLHPPYVWVTCCVQDL